VTSTALLADLRRRGVTLELDDSRLRYRAPAGALTAADRGALAEHRDELLALVRDVASLERDGTAARLCALYAGLTDDDRDRLRAEAGAGDGLAGLIVGTVATGVEPAAAGNAPYRRRPARA